MSMSTLTLPVAESTDTSDQDVVHIYCCDENLSLCGLDISGEFEQSGAPEEQDCEICVNKDRLDLGCLICG